MKIFPVLLRAAFVGKNLVVALYFPEILLVCILVKNIIPVIIVFGGSHGLVIRAKECVTASFRLL